MLAAKSLGGAEGDTTLSTVLSHSVGGLAVAGKKKKKKKVVVGEVNHGDRRGRARRTRHRATPLLARPGGFLLFGGVRGGPQGAAGRHRQGE